MGNRPPGLTNVKKRVLEIGDEVRRHMREQRHPATLAELAPLAPGVKEGAQSPTPVTVSGRLEGK